MPGRRVLITGVGGGTGPWLVRALSGRLNCELHGLGRSAGIAPEGMAYHACDLTDAAGVEQVVRTVRPQLVFHLAALNAFHSPDEIHRVNVGGFANLTAALRQAGEQVRLVTIGSAAEFGRVSPSDLPLDESFACRPHSAYGQSKWTVTEQVRASDPSDKLQLLVARPFNLLGPGLDARLAVGNFARQLAAVRRGEAQEVRCGALDTRRDFVDVRDAAAAYVEIALHGQPSCVYHVCSERSVALGELLERLMRLAGVNVPVVSEPMVRGAGDLPDIYGSAARLRALTGWQPRIALDQSLAEMLAAA